MGRGDNLPAPLFLVGAQKAGTTFLHNLLVQDPKIVGGREKEPHFFSSTLLDGIEWQDIFAQREDAHFLLDSSVSYLHIESTAARIHAQFGSSPPIILVIRDPLRRAISALQHSIKHGRDLRDPSVVLALSGASMDEVIEQEQAAISKALVERRIAYRPRLGGVVGDRDYHDPAFNFSYVRNSFYARQIGEYRKRFDTVIGIDFDMLAKDPIDTVNALRLRLGHDPREISLGVKRNNTKVRRRTAIRKFFRNIRTERGTPAALLATASATPTFLRANLDSVAIADAAQASPWVALARSEYQDLRREFEDDLLRR